MARTALPQPEIAGVPVRPGVALKHYRKMRGLTQPEFGYRLGNYSGSLVAKWESGDRVPDIAQWLKIAGLLKVKVSQLIGTGASGFDAADRPAEGHVLAVREAMLGLPAAVAPADPYAVGNSVEELFRTWQGNAVDRMDRVGRALPTLITLVESTIDGTDGDQRRVANMAGSDLYRLTWAYLRARGAHSWGLVAAEKSRRCALDGKDFESEVAAAWSLAAMLSTTHDTDAAYSLLRKTIARVEAVLADAAPALWGLQGQLHLLSGIQAIRLQRHDEAGQLFDVADRIARRDDVDNVYFTAFGAVNCAIHRAAAEGERSRYHRAIAIAEQIRPEDSPSVERRVALRVQTAHAYLRAKQERSAVRCLAEAIEDNRDETLTLVLARETALELAGRSRPAYERELDGVLQAMAIAS